MFYPAITKFLLTPKGGLLLMFVSAILYSAMGVFTKRAANKGMPSPELVVIRASGQALIVIFPVA